MTVLRKSTTFPVTATDEIPRTDPAEEPTREWVNAHPEGLIARIERTRRYFRLCRLPHGTRIAQGVDHLFEA